MNRWLRLLTISTLLLPAAGFIATGAAKSDQSTPPAGNSAAKRRGTASQAASSQTPAAPPLSFHEDIEPLFKASCGSCHSSDKHFSGLVIETPESLFKGGSKFGAKIILPGKAWESVLVGYLRGKHQPRMPMNGQPLPAEALAKIEKWIHQGAKVDTLKLSWPYTPPVSAPLPSVKQTDWPHNPIDRFILAKLEARGLKPSPPAPRVTLMRRVYADLVGMPPSPKEAEDFLNDASPNAYEKLLDRLLADPRYGERWARHWLDLVRYAETHGFENDGIRPRAWRYRDYVIRSFNADKPYDRFLKEQIAGDELYPNDPDAITATGFARLGPWDELSREPDQRQQDYLNDVTDTTGSVMLGLTVGCARCHNHKYDRITQADYYRLQAFFTQTKWVDTRLPQDSDAQKTVADARRKLEAAQKQIQELRDQYWDAALAAKSQKAQPGQKIEVNDDDIDRVIRQQDRQKRDQIQGEIRRLESVIAPFEPVAEALSDEGKNPKASHLLLRGNLHTPGPEVQPGFIAALAGGTEKPAVISPPANVNTTGRRSALANWIGSADNPMTSRVLVNRLWQHHFGRGLVATPSDFGKNGDRVTHPELLDWLARQMVEGGWSLKKIHKLMLMSAAYQQSTKNSPAAVQADPNNTLLWRMNRIRLEGEALRDSILAVSGRLNLQMGGPGIYPHVSDEVLSTGSTHKWGDSPEEQGRRRAIYVFQRRSLVLPLVEAFDGADMNNTCPRRGTTTIAPQALALFNGEFSRTESRWFAERVVKTAGRDRDKQIETAYGIALSRRPTAAQKALAQTFLIKQMELHLPGGKTANSSSSNTVKTASVGTSNSSAQQAAEQAALAELCHVLINTNEFLYLD